MAKAKKTYEAKVKVLETSFADMKPGQCMAIGTPDLMRQLVAKIPKGKVYSLKDLRQLLARHLGAEVACPVTTSMYLKIAVEKAFDSEPTHSLGKDFPFWRAIDPSSPLFKKLDGKVQDFILNMQDKEQRTRASA
jgi:hypothetical protein